MVHLGAERAASGRVEAHLVPVTPLYPRFARYGQQEETKNGLPLNQKETL